MNGLLPGDSHDRPAMLTVEEAARLLRVGRSLAYQLASRYLASDGSEGIPVLRLGGVLRVPTSALETLITTGHLVQLCEHATPRALVPSRGSRARTSSVDAQLSLLSSD